jgi:hypothetical protein
MKPQSLLICWTNTTVGIKWLEWVLLKATGHEKLKITEILSFLAYGKETDTICFSEEKILSENGKKKKAFLVKLHLNVTERVTDRRIHSQMFGTDN